MKEAGFVFIEDDPSDRRLYIPTETHAIAMGVDPMDSVEVQVEADWRKVIEETAQRELPKGGDAKSADPQTWLNIYRIAMENEASGLAFRGRIKEDYLSILEELMGEPSPEKGATHV